MSKITSPFAQPDRANSASFEQHYAANVKPLEEEFELKRIAALKKRNTRYVISGVGGIVFFAIAIPIANARDLWSHDSFGDAGSLVALAAAGIFYWCQKPIKNYAAKVKNVIFPKIFDFFDHLHYSYEVNVGWHYLQQESQIIPDHNVKELEDQICGYIDDVELDMFEAHLKKVRRSGKHQSVKTVFQGMIISLAMNKNFAGKTVVKKDAGKIGNFFKKSSDLDPVKLESPEFEKMFEVYSSDQVEARYVLTTSFMERLIELANAFGASVQCSFFDNQVLIMLNTTRNLFEISSISDPVNFSNDADIIMKEIKILEQIVDILKLNQRTGI